MLWGGAVFPALLAGVFFLGVLFVDLTSESESFVLALFGLRFFAGVFFLFSDSDSDSVASSDLSAGVFFLFSDSDSDSVASNLSAGFLAGFGGLTTAQRVRNAGLVRREEPQQHAHSPRWR